MNKSCTRERGVSLVLGFVALLIRFCLSLYLESGDDKTDYTTAMIKQSKATVPGPGISASYFKQRSQVHELHVNRTLMESALSLPLLSVIQIQNSVLATISTH